MKIGEPVVKPSAVAVGDTSSLTAKLDSNGERLKRIERHKAFVTKLFELDGSFSFLDEVKEQLGADKE